MTANPIAPKTLARQIGRPDAPQIIDLRIDEDFAQCQRLIPTSCRLSFKTLSADPRAITAQTGPGTPIVIICQKGLKISQGAAALLRLEGAEASHLEGGIVGWTEGNHPTIPADSLTFETSPSRWSCGPQSPQSTLSKWLIRRFVDPKALFLEVDADQTGAVAERFMASDLPTPTHITEVFGLTLPALRATTARAPALLDELWPGLTEPAAFAVIDALFAARSAAQ